ncbi:MAG TPA: hypothetical protein VF490_09335, partial [Chryseosolibacter sp.]
KLTTMICLAVAGMAQAQDYQKRPWMPLENRIGVAMGIGSLTYLDKNTSPLIYRSQPKNLRLFYNLETNHFLFSMDLDLKVGGNAPKYSPERTMFFREEDLSGNTEDKKFPAGGSFLAGRVSMGAFYKISSTQESTFKVAVGGRIMNELFYPRGWTVGGLMNALSLSPEALTQHRVDEHHSFTASVRIPLVALVARPPYDNTVSAPDKSAAGGFLGHSSWVGPSKYLAPALGISYNYQINQKWGAGLNYEFGWYKVAQGETFRAMNQSFLANVYHQF